MNRITKRPVVHLFAIGVLTGCGASLTDPDAAPGTTPDPDAAVTQVTRASVGDTVTLEPGASVTFESADVEVTFLRLVGDSRCPVDVTCVWEGDAEVEVGVVTDAGDSRLRLHTSLEPQAVEVGSHVLRLVDVLPYPVDDPLADPPPLRILIAVEEPAPGA